jgi:bacterioferritin-associated ferredoxin
MHVCYCNNVTEEDIKNAIVLNGARTVKEVIKITGAMQNSNCAVNNPKGVCCYSDIVKTFNQFKNENFANKEIKVDFLYLDLNTCERCVSTDSALNEALDILSRIFITLNYSVTVNKVNITSEELAMENRFVSSPTIRVNGIDICDEVKESDCTDCGDLCGDSVDCRVFSYEGKDYEQPPVAMIVDGILRVIYKKQVMEENSYIMPDNLKKYFLRRNFIMKKMSIYEPALCCDTGICGVSVDTELFRISTVLNALKKNGVVIDRFNLNNAPMAFVNNQVINNFINEKGVDGLPVVMLDDEIIITGRYPSNEEIISYLDIPASYLTESKPAKKSSCCCSDDKCC